MALFFIAPVWVRNVCFALSLKYIGQNILSLKGVQYYKILSLSTRSPWRKSSTCTVCY